MKQLRDCDIAAVARIHALPPMAGDFANAAEVARKAQPDEPLFCFSKAELIGRARLFLDQFPGETAYAVKCNAGEHVIAGLMEAGVKVFDVASVEEMAGVSAIFPAAEFHYHNPIKSRREILRAYEAFGCRRFAVDDASEIEKIREVTGGGADIEIAVRFRLPRLGGSSAHDFSTKFGATRDEAADLLQQVVASGMKPCLTFHPGSQCVNPQAYVRHIQAARQISLAAGVRLYRLNVGGGFPAQYMGDDVPELAVFFEAIAGAVRENFGNEAPALECEPGRGIVATSTSLLAQVKAVKPGRLEVFLNDGIYGALMEISQVPDIVPPHRFIRQGQGAESGETAEFTLYGPTCDPLDRLPVRFELPCDIAEGDYVEFGRLGAYGAATSTRFNGYAPAAIIPVHQVL